MNLKEAFRYQNKLQSLLDEAQGIAPAVRGSPCPALLRHRPYLFVIIALKGEKKKHFL